MKIETVKAFKYDGQLFESKKEVNQYIQRRKELDRATAHAKEQMKLRKPMSFTIKEGYFDFLIFNDNGNSRYVCYRTNSFKDAINKVLKRKDCATLDYEAQILDKNKHGTNEYINLNDMPSGHKVHELTI